MGGVIEQFEKDVDLGMLRHPCRCMNKLLSVVTPAFQDCEQGAACGSELEVHRSFRSKALFQKLGREYPHLPQSTASGHFLAKCIAVGSKDEHLRQKVANWDDFSFSRVLRAVYRLFPYRRWLREGHLFRWYTSRLDR